jgi:hypothetical protein
MVDVKWDDRALHDALVGRHGSIGEEVLYRMATDVALGAMGYANVLTGRLRDSLAPGRSISISQDSRGIYADVTSEWYGAFLEYPARQLHRAYPYLTRAVEDLNGKTYR